MLSAIAFRNPLGDSLDAQEYLGRPRARGAQLIPDAESFMRRPRNLPQAAGNVMPHFGYHSAVGGQSPRSLK
jgi:hypothetical protein